MTAYGNMINQIITNSTTTNNCPLNRITGSSSVGQFVDSMPVINSVVVKNYGGMGINDSIFGCGGIMGGCCGSYINGGWNNGLMTFSDIINDRNEVSFWDSFSAGTKEKLYTDPFGTIGSGLSAVTGLANGASGLLSGLGGILGGGSSSGGGLLSGLTGLFS